MHLILVMDWDDGFVAWLDGQEIRRDRAPGSIGIEPPVGARATSGHAASIEGGAVVTYDLGPVGDRLSPGVHVLALMGLNDQTNSSDLSLIADLRLREATPPPIVAHADDWRYRKGTSAPEAGWQTVPDGALDGTWLTGPGGFGYGDGDDGTELTDMLNGYTTVYIRRTFTITSPPATNLRVLLTMDWDDGFVAYLDGVEVKRELVLGAVGVEPLHTALASGLHEASAGSGGNPPVTYDLGPALALLPQGDHILAIIGLNESVDSSDVSVIADLSLAVPPPGSILTDTTWTAANSPYVISNNITVASGVTLTIEPGVTLLFNQGLGMTINGRLLAEGTSENGIVFSRNVGASTWDQVYFAASSATSRLAHVEMDYFSGSALEAHDTTLHLDSISWTNSTAPAVDLHNSSITLLNSYIPGGAGNEPVHFSGMPASGHALIKGCVFGAPRGYNDSIDFTGGNRPGPIPQFIDNIFLGGVDDCFDMDGTDAHIEGNIFLNVRKDASRDSSSNPITTGADGGNQSELVICRNIFYNGEHAFMEKDFGTGILQNNTILRLTPNPLSNNTDSDGNEAPGIIMFGEPWRGFPYGGGAIFEGNIASDLQLSDPWPVLASAQAANPGFFFLRNYNCVQGFDQPGLGNINADPLFISPSNLTAANIRQLLALQPGSPCQGTGPNGIDMGAIVPSGASIGGVPASPTTNTSATLTIAGPGIWAYRWRLNDGAWSTEVSIVPQSIWNGQPFTADMLANSPPINLSNLPEGTNTLEVLGRNSAGFWQETATTKTWVVETGAPLKITEASRDGDVVTLTFTVEAGKTYSVLYRDAFDDAHPWLKLTDVPAQANTGAFPVQDVNANTSATRFYQVVTPAQP
jgi:hypothetical protein